MVVGAIIGTAAGAAAGAYQARQQTDIKKNALAKSLLMQTAINNKYSGQNALNRQEAAGQAEMMHNNESNLARQASMPNQSTNPMAFNQGYSDLSGYDKGVTNRKAIDSAERDNLQNMQNAALKQAGIDYDVKAAQNQANMNALGNIVNTAKTMSDEDAKEAPVNHDSGLPSADAEDAVSRIESVQYEYKDPSIPGCDAEEHVGTTAQSLEKEDFFADCVSEGEDGFKRVDREKLMSKLPSIMDSLEYHLDKLEKQRNSK